MKLFQKKVGIRPTGVANVHTQELLFSPYAPVYVKPSVIGTPSISIDCYDRYQDGVYYLSELSSGTGYVKMCIRDRARIVFAFFRSELEVLIEKKCQ